MNSICGMKKIAIITSHFPGATFPLVNRFLKNGFAVDYYIVCGKIVDIQEGVSFDRFPAKLFLGEIDRCKCDGLFDYLKSDNFHLYYHRRPRPYSNVPVLRLLMALYLFVYDYLFCRKINKQHYCWVNLVGTYDSSSYGNYLRFINSPLSVSLHEVLPDLLNKSVINQPKWFDTLFKSQCSIVVHSKNTLDDILSFQRVESTRVNLIHFGLFETYRTISIDKDIKLQLPPRYILFFGKILPYKGLDLLYKAVTSNRHLFRDMKFVVAGAGFVECINDIKDDKSFICINRRVTNEELASLISGSLFVVCPYRGISQSGIPQTTFVFNKPIVASRLSAFEEVMEHDRDCLLFERDDSDDLAKQMYQMMMNYSSFVSNVSSFEANNPDYSWDYIERQYETLMTI